MLFLSHRQRREQKDNKNEKGVDVFMNAISKAISDIGVVPVIKLNHPERDAAPLAKALTGGGVPVAEVTFRAAGAKFIVTPGLDPRSSPTARAGAYPSTLAAPPPPTTTPPISWGWRC